MGRLKQQPAMMLALLMCAFAPFIQGTSRGLSSGPNIRSHLIADPNNAEIKGKGASVAYSTDPEFDVDYSESEESLYEEQQASNLVSHLSELFGGLLGKKHKKHHHHHHKQSPPPSPSPSPAPGTTPPSYIPPGGYPYTPTSMGPPSQQPPSSAPPSGETPPGTTPPSYIPPGGYPYTPSAFPSIMADDKPKTKFPGWPVKYPGWPGSYPAPSGDAPPGARELPFTSGKSISIRSPSLGKYCAPDDTTKLVQCNQDARSTSPDDGFLIIGENYVTNKIYEGQSVLMKVQSKFTVCGVSTNKPGNPVECVNTDSEDSTHFAFRFAPAPQPEGKALLQMIPAPGVLKATLRHRSFDDEVAQESSKSAEAESGDEKDGQGDDDDDDTERVGDHRHDGEGDEEGAVQESVAERRLSGQTEGSMRTKAKEVEAQKNEKGKGKDSDDEDGDGDGEDEDEDDDDDEEDDDDKDDEDDGDEDDDEDEGEEDDGGYEDDDLVVEYDDDEFGSYGDEALDSELAGGLDAHVLEFLQESLGIGEEYDAEAVDYEDPEEGGMNGKAQHEILCTPERDGDTHVVYCKKHQADDPLTFLEVEVTSPWA